MNYAPVIIPTLNRYDHFRQCLESLEECTGSEHTDVFIGLDYPPSDNYFDGWQKIKNYLEEKKKNNSFLNLYVIHREQNCGVKSLTGNCALLAKLVLKKYDRYILSEDDNVFSPNFLEFINKGLDKFKDDASVLAINGYRHPYHFKFGGNNYFRHNVDFSAWGYGIWSDRVENYLHDIREDCIFQKTFCKDNILKVKKTGYNRLLDYIRFSLYTSPKEARITDCMLSNYMVIKGMQVIMPSFSKVRNIGWDNQGYSFSDIKISGRIERIANRHQSQDIDSSDEFDFRGDPYLYYKQNNDIAVAESDGKISIFEFIWSLTKTFTHQCIAKIKK